MLGPKFSSDLHSSPVRCPHFVEETPCAVVFGVSFGHHPYLLTLSRPVWMLGTNLAPSKQTPGLACHLGFAGALRPDLTCPDACLTTHRRSLGGWLDHLTPFCGVTWNIKKGVTSSTNGHHSRDSAGANSLGLPSSLFRWSKQLSSWSASLGQLSPSSLLCGGSPQAPTHLTERPSTLENWPIPGATAKIT